jgi:hypothetical protein
MSTQRAYFLPHPPIQCHSLRCRCAQVDYGCAGQASDSADFSAVACQKYAPLKSLVYVDELIYPFGWIHFTDWNAKYYSARSARLAAEIRSNSVTEAPNCCRRLTASRGGLTTGNAFALVAALFLKALAASRPMSQLHRSTRHCRVRVISGRP